jgi:hypothetical protein
MGAITGIVSTGVIPWGNAAASGLIAQVFQIPASTAGDTQTIVANRLSKVLYVLGPVSHTAITTNSVPLITSVTVAASNFIEILCIGPAQTGAQLS